MYVYSGGLIGFEKIKEIINNPNHNEYKNTMEWLSERRFNYF